MGKKAVTRPAGRPRGSDRAPSVASRTGHSRPASFQLGAQPTSAACLAALCGVASWSPVFGKTSKASPGIRAPGFRFGGGRSRRGQLAVITCSSPAPRCGRAPRPTALRGAPHYRSTTPCGWFQSQHRIEARCCRQWRCRGRSCRPRCSIYDCSGKFADPTIGESADRRRVAQAGNLELERLADAPIRKPLAMLRHHARSSRRERGRYMHWRKSPARSLNLARGAA